MKKPRVLSCPGWLKAGNIASRVATLESRLEEGPDFFKTMFLMMLDGDVSAKLRFAMALESTEIAVYSERATKLLNAELGIFFSRPFPSGHGQITLEHLTRVFAPLPNTSAIFGELVRLQPQIKILSETFQSSARAQYGDTSATSTTDYIFKRFAVNRSVAQILEAEKKLPDDLYTRIYDGLAPDQRELLSKVPDVEEFFAKWVKLTNKR